MKRMIPGTIVRQAIRDVRAMGRRGAQCSTRREIAAHYGITPATLSRWVLSYGDMSLREIEAARARHGVRYRKTAAMYGIALKHLQAPGSRGKPVAWQVSLHRSGRDHVKRFHFAEHGGRGPALLAAQAWRDHVAATHHTASRRELATRTTASNTSGVPGVSVGWAVRVSPDGTVRKYRHWLARKPRGLGGNMTQRTFGVLTHGELGAFKLAVKARRAWEAELCGHHEHHAGVARIYAHAACPVGAKTRR